MKIFIFGAGYSGTAVARKALARGEAVAGTSRSTEKLRALADIGVNAVRFERELTPQLRACLAESTRLIVSAGPEDDGDPVLRAIGDDLQGLMPKLAWIGYLSSVGVYGDHDGALVDEKTICVPVNERSVRRLEAEQAWQSAAQAAGLPLAVLRLSGIYGPRRNALANIAEGKARLVIKQGQIFNRIHVEDIAAATIHLSDIGIDGIFNVSDDMPAPPQDVIAHAAEIMGHGPLPTVDFDEAQMSPMARSFWGENKRISNAKLKGTGYNFIHPDYRQALTHMWRSGTWQG